MRYYHTTENNCLQCSIAGILNMRLEQVVDVSIVEHYWVDTLMNWAQAVGVRVRFTNDTPKGVLYISIVDWKVSGCHAIICRDNHMAYNPSPSVPITFTGGLYNMILTKKDNNESIVKDNGEPILAFVDSNDLPKER